MTVIERTRHAPLAKLADVNLPTFHFVSYCMPASAPGRRKTGWHPLDMEQSVHRTQLIRDIAGWQFEDIDKVYEASDGVFRDVTQDIAEAVMDLLVTDRSVPCWELRGWLEDILGIRSVYAHFGAMDEA